MKSMMRHVSAAAVCAAVLTGCGGDDAAGKNMSVSGGGEDPVAQQAKENQKVAANPNDPNFEKMASPDKKNTARNPGVSSGGGTSSAILD